MLQRFYHGLKLLFSALAGFVVLILALGLLLEPHNEASSFSSIFLCKQHECSQAYSVNRRKDGRAKVQILSAIDAKKFSKLLLPHSMIEESGLYRADYGKFCKQLLDDDVTFNIRFLQYPSLNQGPLPTHVKKDLSEEECIFSLFRLSENSFWNEWATNYLAAKYASWFRLPIS
ncbi:MAG: hypothetical protein KDD62_00680 [Bdellovibrionales bacterium]|nr:hypothetical protein [Bdellovibrionales bacterium]